MNEHDERDELFRNRIKTAIHQQNGQLNAFDSNASIKAQLADIDAAPLEEPEVSRIMQQVHNSIHVAAKSREGMDVMQNRTSPKIASAGSRFGDDRHAPKRPHSGTAATIAIVTTSICLLTAIGLFQSSGDNFTEDGQLVSGTELIYSTDPLARSTHHFRYVAQPRPQAAPPERLAVGQTIRTAACERRRVLLPDGSILYLNERSTVALTENRTVALHRGQLFVEVTPANISDQGPFVVETADRSVTALGTKFAVATGKNETEVLVTQGKVRVSGATAVVTGGQVAAASDKDAEVTIDAAPRASQALSWTRELIAAAEPSIVPESDHRGGALIVVDPSGQEMKLSLRKFHVDAHIEDGFARTTIDQTYFNHTHSRQEGTFKFPLPPDASLSRLAMYVNGKLMEGGMVERDHGRNVFEQIMTTKRDPALLEWVDGSTFKMRVFPLEPRQEKRIVLSYTQRLPHDYDRTEYRFPAGHNLDQVRDWSTRLTVANGAGKTRWFSPTHLLKGTEEGKNLVLEGDIHNAVLDKDLVVELTAAGNKGNGLSRQVEESIAFSGAQHEGYSYQMLRFRPNLNGELQRPRRNWVFLYESSGDRNPLLARVQLDVISTMLEHAEHDDTFSVISAATKSNSFRIKPVRCTKKNIAKAVAWLEDAHLVGALDLEAAFKKSKPFCRSDNDSILVHVGSANPVLGERDEKKLLKSVPSDAQYVGVGVGKRWSRAFMKSAAGRTGGHFTQINPDEKVSWRAFELLSTLNAPRLIDLKVDSGRKNVRFLTFADTIAHGQEIAAIARLPLKLKSLESVTVTGRLNGKPFSRKLPVTNVVPKANYLPRTWARLEIDRLVASGSAANKDTIITLSKAMYVMSPFTSLLVLEDEAMYEQFNVDRGRKDHWALYPAPDTIRVVHEPGPTLPEVGQPVDILERRLKEQTARRDVAQANLDLGKRDSRTPAELAKLTSLLTREARDEEVLRNRLKLAAQIESRKSENVAKTVLYRRLPSVAAPAAYVNRLSRRRRFSTLSWDRKQFNLVPQSGIAPMGEPEFWSFWGRQPKFTPNDIELYGFSKTESNGDGPDVDFTVVAKDSSLLVDPSVASNWGSFRYDTSNREVIDGFINEQMSRYEVDYRRKMRGEGIESQIIRGYVGRGGNRTTSRLLGRNTQGIDQWFLTELSFDVDVNTNGLVDESFLRARPRILIEEEEHALTGLGFIPASGGNNPARFGRDYAFDDSSTLESPVMIDLSFPILDDRSHEIQSAELPLYVPLFCITIYDADGLLNLNAGPSARTVTTTGFVPVTPYYSTLIEDNYNEEGRYGKVPVLDEFNFNVSGNEYYYVSTNDPNVSRDEILPFITFEQERLLARNLSNQLQPGRFQLPNPIGRGRIRSRDQIVQLPIQRPGVIRNILSYAPGMQTSTADLLAVVDAESEPSRKPNRGTIDPAALQLIKTARSLGWEEITFVGNASDTSNKLLCNGSGAIRLERQTADGLLEQVISDGTMLQHLYPEIGIGAKRTISRFHRRALLSITPWLLPPVEELAIGCNVELVSDNTIRITRIETQSSDTRKEGNEKPQESDKEKTRLAIELVFDDDGRVSERRLVKLPTKTTPTQEVLLRHVYAATGAIRILDKDDKLLAEMEISRKSIEAPSKAPVTDGMVILPLPYRSADSYSLVVPAKPAGNGGTDYSNLSEADALKLVATHVATSDFSGLWNVINQRFAAKDDHRMGFAVLLSASAVNNSKPIHEVASHSQGSSALGSFVVQHFDWWKDQDRNKEFVLPESASPFLSHLAEIHNLYALWSSGRATQDRTETQVNKELNRALELVRTCRSRSVAWTLLSTVHKSISESLSSKKLFGRLASEAASFEDDPALGSRARLARVQWLISAGRKEQARQLYEEFLSRITKAGFTPVLSDEIRSGFITQFGDSKAWSDIILASAEPLAKEKRSFALMQLAQQCATITEADTATQLLDKAITGVNLRKRPDLLITGLQCLITIGDWKRAEEFARQLMQYRNADGNAALWRTASQIVGALGDSDESLRRLEQAMRLEFAALPDMVNVQSFRGDYNNLFDRFTTFAEESLTTKKRLPNDFVERIAQAADAWRSVDPDPTQACQRAAKLLQLVGLHDAAWEYWTTPLVNTANSSAAWSNLAGALQETNQLHLAGQAWSEAFAAEPTNPELLWHHATLLRSQGHTEKARPLLNQIVTGKWQPRFASIQSKARSALKTL